MNAVVGVISISGQSEKEEQLSPSHGVLKRHPNNLCGRYSRFPFFTGEQTPQRLRNWLVVTQLGNVLSEQ